MSIVFTLAPKGPILISNVFTLAPKGGNYNHYSVYSGPKRDQF